MQVQDIYKKFNIPNNLAEHMITVTMVVKFLRKHWTGNELDWNKLIKAALLHDLGNIVKFDMDKFPEFMGEEVERIDYWKKAQKDVIKKYSSDDHEATKKMLSELGIEKDLIKLILDKSFGNVIKVVENGDWYVKVLLFADLKVSPMGIMLTEERIGDIKNRMPHYAKRKDFPGMIVALKKLDEQIQDCLKVSIHNVSNEVIFFDKSRLLQRNI